jgi:Resolvase, N terminal domain
MTPTVRRDTARPVAYIRRSVEKRRPEDRDGGAGQRAEIAALAERLGEVIAPADVYAGDWNISGQRDKRDARKAMAAILAAIRAGEITAVYAYAVDRLARDDAYGLTIRDACEDAGVLVHTKLDGSFDMSDERDRDYWGRKVTDAAVGGRRYTRVNQDTKEEARRHIWGDPATGRLPCPKLGRTHKHDCDHRCIPGEHCAYAHTLGGKPVYGHDPDRPAEDAAVVVAAYREAKSYLGAVRKLNDAGVPTRHGKPWTVRSVVVLVRREAPEVARVHFAHKGVSASRTHIFSRLLTCHCGAILSSLPRQGRPRVDGTTTERPSVAYYCDAGKRDIHHGPPFVVAESKIIAWMEPLASEWDLTFSVPEAAAKAGATLASIAASEAAIVNLIVAGKLSEAAAAHELDKLHARAAIAQSVKRDGFTLARKINWRLPPAEVNAALRARWSTIRLGPDLLPVEAVEVERF